MSIEEEGCPFGGGRERHALNKNMSGKKREISLPEKEE